MISGVAINVGDVEHIGRCITAICLIIPMPLRVVWLMFSDHIASPMVEYIADRDHHTIPARMVKELWLSRENKVWLAVVQLQDVACGQDWSHMLCVKPLK